MSLCPQANSLQNSIKVLFYFLVRKPQEAYSKLLNIVLPLAIFLQFPFMRIAINFNSQRKSWAKKVDNLFINRFLAMKIVSE